MMNAPGLSPAQYRLLKLIVKTPVDVRTAAECLNTTVAGAQITRCRLRDLGLVADWNLWGEPIVITDAGLEALGV